ncbi:hypothetical protein EC973_005505, partial [Apophysomyces ossiformis]
SSRAAAEVFKPDWVVFVRPWFARFDLGICEVKPEGKQNPGAISDKVKLGLEMQAMINTLTVQGLDEPRACAILVKGFTLETHIMDRQHLPVSRLVLLDSVTLLVKIATMTAYNLDALQASNAKGKRKLPSNGVSRYGENLFYDG